MIVYKIENLVNGKCYVGQTIQPLKFRIAEHKSSKTSLIGRAIKKYGWENFKVEIISECKTFEELDEQEKLWIKKLNCKSPNGYNIMDGGQKYRTSYDLSKMNTPESKMQVKLFLLANKIISSQWLVPILNELSLGAKKFNELKREIDITHSTLAKHLKLLVEEGLVHREVFPEVPPRVEYSLTEIGKSFQPVLDSIETWGKKYIDYLKERDKKFVAE